MKMSTESLFEAKFKTDSWHRHLAEYVFGHDMFYEHIETGSMYVHRAKPVSLCKYFWSVNLAIVSLPFVAMYRSLNRNYRKFFIVVLVYAPLFTFQYFVSGLRSVLTGLVLVGSIFGITTFVIFPLLDKFHHPKEEPPKPPKQEKPKQPNIYWQYIAARKKKICPIIQWE